MAADLPNVYVVVTGIGGGSEWGDADHQGVLLTEAGEELWGHWSSSLSWLKGDLTTRFGDRRVQLEARYPDGYNVVICERRGTLPPEVEAAWMATWPKEESETE